MVWNLKTERAKALYWWFTLAFDERRKIQLRMRPDLTFDAFQNSAKEIENAYRMFEAS